MKAMKLTLAVAIVLVSTSPAFSHFVKAALGFRLGYSPTEQKGNSATEKKGVGVQAITGINNGGWQGQQGGGLQAAGSGYGSVSQGRSFGGGPLDAHAGHGAVKHLRILGLNLYLGGRAVNGLGGGVAHKPPLINKPIYNLVQHQPQQYYQHQPHDYLHALSKPISLGASVGSGVKPIISHAPNGGKIIGGQSGVRAAVGLPNFGLGFNLGYKQGINTKSPLGHVFGLAGPIGGGKYYAPIHKGPVYKGQDQVHFPGGGLLKGHGHDVSHTPSLGGQSPFFGAYPHGFESSGLESKQHLSTQPHPAASNNAQAHLQQQHSQQSPQTSQSQHQPQQAHGPAKHQGLQGPMTFASSYRNPFLALFSRPSILRPTQLHYSFNSPKPLSSGPIRMVLSPHPPTPAPQRQHGGNSNNQQRPQGWSTLFPIGGPQTAATNSFINPIPPNGQPLAKFHATLRPSNNPFHSQHSQGAHVTSAQNQVPFLHQANHQQPQQQAFQGYFPQALQGQPQFSQAAPLQNPQNNFQQFFSTGFQQQQASGAPQIAQEFSPFQQPALQHFQMPQQTNFQQGPLIPQQFFNQIQEQPVQAASPSSAQAKQSNTFPNIQGLPFNPESVPFAPEPGFQYSHSTESEPVKMGDFTLHMDMSNNNGANSAEQSQSGSEVPMFGPMGRRLKKTKKSRQDVIVKKQGSAAENDSKNHDIMETSATTNVIHPTSSITLASSMGATSWTPIVFNDTPKLEKKSLEMKETKQVSASVQVVDKKPTQPHSQRPVVPTAISSGFFTVPAPSIVGKQDRTMILRRRLNLSSAEALNTAPTVIPAMTSTVSVTSTSSAPSSTSTTTTTTTSTTTSVPPSSSSTSSSPSASSSSTTVSSSSSSAETSSVPVTTTTIVSA